MDVGKLAEDLDKLGVASRDQTKSFKKSTSTGKRKEVITVAWGANPPERYVEKYGRPVPLEKGKLEGAFMNGRAGHGSPLIARRPNEVLPGVYSFDSDFLEFLGAVADRASKDIPVDLDEDGFSTGGVFSDFENLKCPSGYFQTPMSYTAVDNSLYREELGLTPGYSPRQRAIAKEFWNLAFREADVCSVNVAKLSTGGMRRFTSDVQWKLDFADYVTQPATFERMLTMVRDDDAVGLANEFETLYATYIQKRGQLDKVGKVRKVADLEYALSGGRRGSLSPTDKKVVIEGREWPDFSAVRARVVHAGPWTINCFLQMVASPTMKALFRRWPGTFHVNTASDLKARVDGKLIYCSDVTEYDRSMSRDALDVVHEEMAEYWDDRIVKASKRLFESPYYAKPLDIGGKGGTWVMDPTDWTSSVFAGNRSGHALTSLVAKGNKVIETLFIIDRIYPVLGKVDFFLSGKAPIGLINNGDDEVITFDEQRDYDRFVAIRSDLKAGHYVVEAEAGMGFSGLLITRPDASKREYFPIPKIHTSVQKMFVPERGIGGFHRRNWPIGMTVRIDNLFKSDNGMALWGIVSDEWRRLLEPRHGDIRAIVARGYENLDFAAGNLSAVDREVLDDPDKIHFKILPEEVSPHVLDQITTKIPPVRVEQILNRYYKGHLK